MPVRIEVCVMTQQSNLTNWLAENPKMMGALWMLLLILAESGSVAAAGTMSGP